MYEEGEHGEQVNAANLGASRSLALTKYSLSLLRQLDGSKIIVHAAIVQMQGSTPYARIRL